MGEAATRRSVPSPAVVSVGSLPYAATRKERRQRVGDGAIALAGLAATLLVVAALTARGLGGIVAVLLVGLVGLLGMLVLALTRFEQFLVVLFVTRTALDHFKPQGAPGLLEPPSLIGALTLVVGVAWLWQRRRQGLLVETSRVTPALVGLSVITFINPVFAVGRSESLQSAVRFLSFTVLFAVLEQIFRTDPDARWRVLKAVCWSLVLPALVALQQFVRGERTDEFIDVGRVRGTFFHPNPFGTYLVMVLVIALVMARVAERRVRPLLHLAAAASAGLLLLTYARAAWLAAIIGLVVLGIRLDRRILRVLLVGGILVLVAVPSVAATSTARGSPATMACAAAGQTIASSPLLSALR